MISPSAVGSPVDVREFRPVLADPLGWAREITIGLALACVGAVASTLLTLALTSLGMRDDPAMILAPCLTLGVMVALALTTRHSRRSHHHGPAVVAIHGVGGAARARFLRELREAIRPHAAGRFRLSGIARLRSVERLEAAPEPGTSTYVVADSLGSALLLGLYHHPDSLDSLSVWVDDVIIVAHVNPEGRRICEAVPLSVQQQDYLRRYPKCLDEPDRILGVLEKVSRN